MKTPRKEYTEALSGPWTVGQKHTHLRAVFADDPSVDKMTEKEVLETWEEVGEETCLRAMKMTFQALEESWRLGLVSDRKREATIRILTGKHYIASSLVGPRWRR